LIRCCSNPLRRLDKRGTLLSYTRQGERLFHILAGVNSMSDTYRILLADDHVLVAEGIQKLLEPEYELVGIVADGRSLVAAAAKLQPDIVVVDISLPLLNGLDASQQLKKNNPNLKIIVLTMHSEPNFVTQAFRVGVSGYVLKQSVGSELVQAIREVVKGRTFVSPMVAQSLVDQAVNPSAGSAPGEGNVGFAQTLSARQREVLQLVAEGKATKEIASILNVSVKTVEFHKTRIMKELRLRTAAELTKYAIAAGLTSIH
jgi:DNA-binding NarL/FixJ family response regulator